MNRLILVGNGFDLAHNLPTKYSDFIFHYLKSCFEKAKNNTPYKDEILEITSFDTSYLFFDRVNSNIDTIDNMLNFLDSRQLINPKELSNKANAISNSNQYNLKFTSSFAYELFTSFRNAKWVDIEQYYYRSLKNRIINTTKFSQYDSIEIINDSFKKIKEELKKYLTGIDMNEPIQDYFNKMFAK